MGTDVVLDYRYESESVRDHCITSASRILRSLALRADWRADSKLRSLPADKCGTFVRWHLPRRHFFAASSFVQLANPHRGEAARHTSSFVAHHPAAMVSQAATACRQLRAQFAWRHIARCWNKNPARERR